MALPALGDLGSLLELLDLFGLDLSGVGSLVAGAGLVLLAVAGVLVAVVALTAVVLISRRRGRRKRRLAQSRAADDARLRELEIAAGSALVRLDDAVRSADEELGFAVAEYGDEAAAPLATAVARARARLTEAFGIRQRLDDAIPETPAERRDLTARILDLCRSGEQTLDEAKAALDRLRAADRRAGEQVESLVARLDGVAARADAAEKLVGELRTTHGDDAVTDVADNPAQARRLAGYARPRLDSARAAQRSGGAGVVAPVDDVQRAVGQIDRLLDAVTALDAELREFGPRLDGAIADARADLAQARAAEPTPAITEALAMTEAALAEATTNGRPSSLAALECSDAALERALAEVRGADDRRVRADASLDRVLGEARAAVARARDYIATRRGGIGPEARTRLSRAESRLTDALGLASADPAAALENAQESLRYADEALQAARRDVDGFRADDGSGRPRRADELEELGSALLGGILDSVFTDRRRDRRF